MSTIKVGKSEMPAVGLGIWKIDKEDAAQSVYDAIEVGYRHIDSAADYGNEKEAGEGIAKAIADGLCTRDELWITSKLWNTFHREEHVREGLQKTLDDLGLEYLDLYLIHFPISMKYVPLDKHYPPEWFFDPGAPDARMEIDPVPLSDTWRGMEAAARDGLAREIGVCNYNSGLLHDLMAYSTIKPSMLQIESHPFLTQENLIRLAGDYGIAVTAFSPLGALSYVQLDMATDKDTVLTAAPVVAAAERTGKSPAQVVLRWGLQRGTSIIPKTTKKERLKENIDLFDFELTAAEMDAIADLNQNRRFNDTAVFCEAAFNKFYPIYD
ncbi:MAG: aldo/keto reductase [Woeseiaceae bacterium]|nr:aldo/keto reductase [Woeseiaceae bacterium]